jgi:hypothetical protein
MSYAVGSHDAVRQRRWTVAPLAVPVWS